MQTCSHRDSARNNHGRILSSFAPGTLGPASPAGRGDVAGTGNPGDAPPSAQSSRAWYSGHGFRPSSPIGERARLHPWTGAWRRKHRGPRLRHDPDTARATASGASAITRSRTSAVRSAPQPVSLGKRDHVGGPDRNSGITYLALPHDLAACPCQFPIGVIYGVAVAPSSTKFPFCSEADGSINLLARHSRCCGERF